VLTAKPVFTDFGTNAARKILVPEPATATHAGLSGTSVDDAKKTLEAAGVVVDKVEQYDPARGARNLVEFTGAPVRLEAGTRVKLVTRDDKVLFFTRAEEPSPAVAQLRTDVNATRKVVDENSAAVTASKAEVEKILPQLTDLSARVESAKTAVDQATPQIRELQSQVERANATIGQTTPQIEGLRAQIERASSVIDKTAPQIEDIQAKVTANTSDIAADRASIADALRMRDELTGLRNELLQVRQTHQQELAARDKEIADLQASARDFQATVQRVNDLRTQVEKLSLVRPPVSPRSPRKKTEPK
jgi:chromosome segregation ATPase